MNAFASSLIIRTVRCHQGRRKCCDQARVTVRAINGSGGKKRSTGMQRESEEYARELAWAERKYGRRLRRPVEKKTEVEKNGETSATEIEVRTVDARDIEATEKANKEYNALRRQLFGDTMFVGAMITAAAWSFGSVTSAESAAFGSIFGLFYVFLLSRGIAGATSASRGEDKTQGSRIGLLVGLIIIVAKSNGNLQIIPAILGFFSYKLAFIIPLISGEAFTE